MSYMQFPTLFECKKTRKVSHDQIEVLPKTLTLDPNFIAIWHPQHLDTLFKEVTIVPPERVMTLEMRKLFKTRFGYSKVKSDAHYFAILYRYFSQAVARSWKPKMFHVILHSSGFDSRMLSWTIKTLSRRRGWLGKVIFLCTKWEGALFKQIMRYERWHPSQYLVVGENRQKNEYYAPIYLDFESIWQHTNGAASKLNNIGWYLIDQAQKDGLIPENGVQLFTGEWGNSVFDAASGPRANRVLATKWRWRYMSYPCSISYKCDELVQPFTDIGLVRRILVSEPRFGRLLRPKLLSWVNPGLSKIKCFRTDERFFPSGTPPILSRLLKGYNDSWYARNVRKLTRLPAQNQHSAAWSYVSSASFCEYLLSQGYEIRIA